MSHIISTILVLAFIGLIVFFVAKEAKVMSKETGGIPKEYKNIFFIMGLVFLAVIGVLIYTNFFMDVHYNY